jgi:hypothetical protein
VKHKGKKKGYIKRKNIMKNNLNGYKTASEWNERRFPRQVLKLQEHGRRNTDK